MFPVQIIGQAEDTDRTIKVRSVERGKIEDWDIPEETPTAFVYNDRNHAILLATPQDLTDYAVGFSLTERIIDGIDDIQNLDIVHGVQGVDLKIKLSDAHLERFDVRQRRRNLVGNAGCGLCGLESSDSFFRSLPKVSPQKKELSAKVVESAMAALRDYQPINQRTHSVHGAAWANLKGEIMMLREDVGRHNALDKLLGALALAGMNMQEGFVVMSSRCSYELIEKAALCGVTALVAISGPTSFALRKAEEANMTLYARAKNGVVELLT